VQNELQTVLAKNFQPQQREETVKTVTKKTKIFPDDNTPTAAGLHTATKSL